MARTGTPLSLHLLDPSDLGELVTQLNLLFSQIENALDQSQGLHGAQDVWNSVTVHGDLTVTGRITSANGSNPPDASV